jgi:hypothetical protein
MTTSVTPAQLLLSFGELTVAARGDDRRHLAWLREFLEPDFRAVDRGEAACSVHTVEDSERFREALGAGPAPDATLLDCFALDSNVVRLPILGVAGGVTRVFDAQFDTVYEIDPSARRVDIVTMPGRTRVRGSLLRVVREFAMNHAHERGLFLHASAVAAVPDGAALVVTGPRSTGKTTLLTYLLSRGVGGYLSNDRVLVTESTGRQLLRNVPTVISVRPPMLDFFPEFRERFLASGFTSYLSTLDEARGTAGEPILSNRFGTYFLSPAQYRCLLDATQRTECTAGALVFPRVSDDLETFEIREISGEEAGARLPESFLGAGSWRKGPGAFSIPGDRPAPDAADLAARAERFVAGVRAFECRLGPRAYRDGALAAALAATV